jgi:hypothetical protein
MNLTRIGGVLLAVALPFVGAGVAAASPETSLELTITDPKGDVEVSKLECDPPGGSHPSATSACWELHMARGVLDALADQQQPTNCTMEYRPMTAHAEGVWHGKPVEWTKKFSNDCTLHTATGTVFDF